MKKKRKKTNAEKRNETMKRTVTKQQTATDRQTDRSLNNHTATDQKI